MQEEMKSKLNPENACYHSVQSVLSSHLLSRNVNITIQKIIILPVVLCGCETWYLTLREEHRQRVFENRVLRGIFGVTGEWKKLHSGELYDLYSSPDIRIMRWAGACGMNGRGKKFVQGSGG
jgi:hypothetical protein